MVIDMWSLLLTGAGPRLPACVPGCAALQWARPRRYCTSSATSTGRRRSSSPSSTKPFDTFNSRHVLDGKLHRSAFGLSQTIEDQYSCLLRYTQVMRDARVVGSRSLLPFQKGFLMSSVALRGLLNYVRCHHGLTYLLISSFNQDCVDNFLSQVSISGHFQKMLIQCLVDVRYCRRLSAKKVNHFQKYATLNTQNCPIICFVCAISSWKVLIALIAVFYILINVYDFFF